MNYNDALLKSRIELASRVLSHMCDPDLHEATMALVEKLTKRQKLAMGAILGTGIAGAGAGLYKASQVPKAPAAVTQSAGQTGKPGAQKAADTDVVKDTRGNPIRHRGGVVKRAKNRAR